MKDSYFFGFIFVVFFVVFLYVLFPVPFILERYYWDSNHFNWVMTCSSCLILFTSGTHNSLLIHLLRKNNKILGSVNYLYIMMLVGDILYPWFYLPIGMTFSWLHQSDAWHKIDLEKLIYWSRLMSSIMYGLMSYSVTSFNLCCICRIYPLVTNKQFPVLGKVAIGIIPFFTAIILFSVNQIFSEEKWCHSFVSAMVAFLPITASFLGVLFFIWYRKFCQVYENKRGINNLLVFACLMNFFLSWIPMFTISNIHIYHMAIDFKYYSKLTYITPMLVMLKSPCNLLVAILSDKTIRKECRSLLMCRCFSEPEENNNSAAVYYTSKAAEGSIDDTNVPSVNIGDDFCFSDTKILIEK